MIYRHDYAYSVYIMIAFEFMNMIMMIIFGL